METIRAPKQNQNKTKRSTALSLMAGAALILLFQNCSNKMSFEGTGSGDTTSGTGDTTPPPATCVAISCDGNLTTPTPLTTKPAVTTILMALGDELSHQLVVNGGSAQLIAETVIRYTSPKTNPKILFVHDHNSGGESAEDTKYASDVLLGHYDVTHLDEPVAGLTDADLAGFDVVWWNNPGNPMGSSVSRDTLLRYKGGVVLQGDDMAWGQNFSNDELTGLTYIDNGTSIRCGDKSIGTDNNAGAQFHVTLNSDKIPNTDASTIEFNYGNDIDNTVPARSDLEVIATAKGSPAECTQVRPAIVRYLKPAITIGTKEDR